MDNRYYFNQLDGNVVVLDKTETQHLSRVRRATIGDEIVGFCGDGIDYKLKVQEIGKNNATCVVIDKIKNKSSNKTQVDVYLASLKNDALSESVDNITQLNANAIFVFNGEYSVANIDDDKIEKLKIKSIQACKQCERASFLHIEKIKYEQMLKKLQDYDLALFAYENCGEKFDYTSLKQFKDKKIAIVVGCEGGFSSVEVKDLSKICRTACLGKTILRAPVAVTSFLASVMSGLGEWEYEI